jgi:carboxymethylenebutenolidase
MARLTAQDFHPEVLKLFDKYVHNQISRADFISGAAAHAKDGESGESLLAQLSPKFAEATQVQPDDPRIATSWVEIDSPQGYGKIRGYLVKPVRMSGKLPAVLVVHENRGLNPHIQDIARRLALDDFIALAPDALTSVGGYPGDEDKARALFADMDRAKFRQDFLAAGKWLQVQPDVARIGATGFCFGGGVVNYLATQLPDLAAAVPFYGNAADTAEAGKIRAALLIHYAEHDERINAQRPAYEAALNAAGVKHEMHAYPGTQHGFNNATTPRYDVAAANLAWGRTLAFFNANLR